MKLTPEERETIILYDESTDKAKVYTHDKKLIEKLKRLHKKYPELICTDRKEHPGAVSYIVPKKCIMVHEPYSEARRKADSERARRSGRKPPVRTKKSV
ncbi:MAG: immunoglobulin [Eubacteriales bacterium]|jgi:hypothetical protein